MYRDRTVIGIIPARGGSKGLPGKNIRNLAGRPLIAWTIERALSSEYFDRVIVNTDDRDIACVAERCGAEVPFLRPEELAHDRTPMMDVVRHTIDYFREINTKFDYTALLEPTSPLRKPDDIDRAIKQLIDREKEADSLVSVGEVHLEHPSIMKKVSEGKLTPYEVDTGIVTRRQELEEVYFPYGVIYLTKTDKLLEHGTFYLNNTIPYFIERWQNYEVDDIYDFIAIEAVMHHELKEVAA
jgi:CMP-N,N'-diacetyllegionaminic acid synthase